MKKTVFAVTVLFLIGSCSSLPSITNPTPNVDVAATSAANVMNAVAQTLTAQPTLTSLPPTLTLEATLSPTTVPPTTISEPATAATGTFVVATSTNLPASIPAGSGTVTPTLGVLTYGTLPPAVPFTTVTLINRSKRQAYISLQVVTDKGGPTIIEYPVSGQIKIKAPIGQYLYVAWVGGREMVGEFRLHKDQDLSIILYKDRVEI